MDLLTFNQALADSGQLSKCHVLLGNGFSIACRPNIFLYGKLYEQADFSKLSQTAKVAFEALNTQDFERVITALRHTEAILEAYGGAPQSFLDTLQSDCDGLRELLVETITSFLPIHTHRHLHTHTCTHTLAHTHTHTHIHTYTHTHTYIHTCTHSHTHTHT